MNATARLTASLVLGLLALRPLAGPLPDLPAGGVPVLTPANKWSFNVQPEGARAVTYQRQTVSDGPIVQCRISSLATTALWRTWCELRFTNAFARGDVVLITGRARTLETTNTTGRGLLRCTLRSSVRPQEDQNVLQFEADREWSRFHFPAVLGFDIPASRGVLIFNLGFAVQLVELCDVQLYRFPPGVDPARLPKTDFTPIRVKTPPPRGPAAPGG